MAHLLIVDDEESICWGLSKLAEQMGHRAATASSAEEGLELAGKDRPDVIVLDVRLPGMDGLEAMKGFKARLGAVPIIVMTAYGELATAIKAVRNGAFDYLTKPFDLDQVQRTIERALQVSTGPAAQAGPPQSLGEDHVVGKSPAMQTVFKRIALAAASDACVHLRGESGTGKELAARAIHRYSRRASGPFVPVNVAALAPTAVESELFGQARGAFTGGGPARKGLLEQAGGGTVFLDEVANIPVPTQVKLLRALEHGEALPVGADQAVQVDIRVISATCRNLAAGIAGGGFRHDLYYRLITFEIEMPALRDRPEDIRPLIEHFLTLQATTRGWPPCSISQEAATRMERLPWYGNVRELYNAIEHATVLAHGRVINVDHLPLPLPASMAASTIQDDGIKGLIRQWAETQLQDSQQTGDLYNDLLNLVEPPLLEAATRFYHGHCATAARRLGMHRTTLRKKLDQFGVADT